MNALTDHAIDFALNVRWEHLPAGVQHQAKRCLLDTMGALIAGSQTPVAGIVRTMAREPFGGDQATIMVSGGRNVKGRPGACALPPLLAAAELAGGCSGRNFLTALVIAYELGIRAGVIRHATYAVYHSSGSWGAVASMVAREFKGR